MASGSDTIGSMRILLVDDEELSRRGLRAMIGRSLAAAEIVGEASDGQAAVEAVETLQPDVVLMDIRMPEMDGVEAATRIAELSPYTRIVFLTAYDEFEYAREAVRLGADAYLLKPVEEEDLVRVLEESIRKRTEQRRVADFDQREEIEKVRRWAAMQLVYALIQGDHERYEQVAGFLAPASREGTLVLVEFGDTCEGGVEYLDKTLARKGPVYTLKAGNRTGVFFLPSADLQNAGPRDVAERIHRKGSAFGGVECRVRAGQVTGAGDASRRLYRPLSAVPADAPAVFVLSGTADSDRGRRGTGYDFSPLTPEIRGRLEEILAGGDDARRRSLVDALVDDVSSRSPDPDLAREWLLELIVLFRVQLATLAGPGAEPGAGRIESGYLRSFLNAVSEAEIREFARSELHRYDAALRELQAGQEGRYSWRVTRAVDHILANLSDDLYLDVVAEKVGVSPQHLSRLFKEELETTFTCFVNDQRMERARYLLLATPRGIAEIAHEVGFRDADYFSRVFRKFSGRSPSEYRTVTRSGDL